MTRADLIVNIQEFISGSYGIPIQINPTEITRRIDDALRYFYREYHRAKETRFYIIPREYFGTSEFKEIREIQMPQCVEGISQCKLTRGGLMWGFNDGDFSVNKLFSADVMLGSFSSDDLILRTAYMSYYDLARAFVKEHVKFNWNPNTKRVIVEGGDPHTSIFLETDVKIEEELLFDDYLFIDYVRGAALMSLGRMTNIFQMNLPGGVTLGTAELKSEGKELMESVKTKIKEEEPVGYFQVFR